MSWVSGHGEFFVGGRTRLACATAVRLLDDRRLVCTNCVGMRMYLVDYDLDSGTYEFRTQLPTEFDGVEVETDLLDVDEHGLIATSNCGATCAPCTAPIPTLRREGSTAIC